MAKYCHPDIIDAALNYIKTYADEMVICNAEPTTYTEAHTTFKIGDIALDSDDFTLAAGDVSGRKVIVGAQTNVTVDDPDAAIYIALTDISETKLLYVTTCTEKALVDLANTPAWDIEIADPT